MSDIVISVENLTKEYRIGTISHRTFQRDLQAWWARLRGKEDPNLPVDGGRRKKLEQFADENGIIHALKDVSFEVRQGEVLGIIGKNGAGKSTLLKILSRVTAPTSGCVKIKGRIGSLLEVGTGFHPELTGRENIYMNGAILGMKKREIDRKLDEIIDFSGVEQFIDTPVKRYSSGMYVRLAFAVAAHLDPEILVVDEVLAVGDAEFQKKCLGKMDDVSKKEGRTVLFVSHNMVAMQNLCKCAILIKEGVMVSHSETHKVIEDYLSGSNMLRDSENIAEHKTSFGESTLFFHTEGGDNKIKNFFMAGDSIRFVFRIETKTCYRDMALGLGILDSMGSRVLTFHTMYQYPNKWSSSGNLKITADWPESILCPGIYRFVCALYEKKQMILLWEDFGRLTIVERDYYGTGHLPDPVVQGRILTKAKWRIGDEASKDY